MSHRLNLLLFVPIGWNSNVQVSQDGTKKRRPCRTDDICRPDLLFLYGIGRSAVGPGCPPKTLFFDLLQLRVNIGDYGLCIHALFSRNF